MNYNKTPEYRALHHAKTRCYNTNYPLYHRYGGRGIRVCDRWNQPGGHLNFIADMGPRPSPAHSLERKDNDGDYEPNNCVWATKAEQALNRSTNRMLPHDGKTQHLSVWAKQLGMRRSTLEQRLAAGWPIDRALTTPVRKLSKATKKEKTTWM